MTRHPDLRLPASRTMGYQLVVYNLPSLGILLQQTKWTMTNQSAFNLMKGKNHFPGSPVHLIVFKPISSVVWRREELREEAKTSSR